MNAPLPHLKFRHSLSFGLLAVLLTSCGSYQQAYYYDTDGIYATEDMRPTERVVVRDARSQRPPARSENAEFYQDYFGQRAQELDQILESEVFTDIDSYSSTGQADSLGLAQDSQIGNPNDYFDSYNNDYAGNPGWGDSGSNVSINFYGNSFGWGWNAPGWNNWGWYDPWVWNYGWGWVDPFYYGWGWNNWGWNRWGWNRWGWNNWGWGYGWGWNNWGWNNPYYGYNRYAWGYNRGRRGYYTRDNLNLQGARYASTRANTTTRLRNNSGRSNARTNDSRYGSSRYSRSRVNADAAARNRAYRSSRSTRSEVGYNGRSSRTYTGNSANSARRTYGTYGRNTRSGSSGTYSAPRSGTYRGNSGSSRSGGTYRSSGSSSRSSGTFRSSGGSSRSSGSFRSSGGGSRSSGSFRSSGGGSRSSGGGRSGGRSNG